MTRPVSYGGIAGWQNISVRTQIIRATSQENLGRGRVVEASKSLGIPCLETSGIILSSE